MKKICYGLCCLLAVMFVSNVYAADDQWIVALSRGESVLLERYEAFTCANGDGYIAFEVDGKCLVTNDLAADRTTDLNILAYTDTETSTKYYVGLNSDEVPHYAGKVLPYELTYLINNENSVARKFYIDDMTVENGAADWFIYAGYLNDKIYVYYGNENVGYVVPYEYNTSTRVMSYAYSSVDPTDIQTAATLESHYLFLFLVESDPNFATEAKAIMQDTNKLALVDVADVFDDGTSDWSLSLSGSNTVFNFAMLLNDNKATAFVNSYNDHLASGESPEFTFVSEPDEPEVPADPDPLPATPPADPTQPTQPTEPVQQPNTGTYLPLIGVVILAVVGGVLIKNKKSKFNRI